MSTNQILLACVLGSAVLLISGCARQPAPVSAAADSNRGESLIAADPLGAAVFEYRQTRTETATSDNAELGI